MRPGNAPYVQSMASRRNERRREQPITDAELEEIYWQIEAQLINEDPRVLGLRSDATVGERLRGWALRGYIMWKAERIAEDEYGWCADVLAIARRLGQEPGPDQR